MTNAVMRWALALCASALLAACGGGGAASAGDGSNAGASSGGSSAGNTQQLAVQISGSGTVASSPSGISCSAASCSAAFTSGAAVTLTATAGAGYTFSGWSGACSGSGACTVTLSAAQSVTATFAVTASTSVLTVSKVGTGTVTGTGISCGSDCSEAFSAATSVTLTAAAGTGYSFLGWSGACSGTGTCTVTMGQAREVTATFVGQLASGCTLPRGTVGATPSIPTTHPRILVNHAATKTCLQQLLAAGTSSATRFKGMVDSQMAGGNIYGFEPWYAALMYQVTGDTKYATYAIQTTEAFVASEEALITAGQRASVAGDSYLDVGPLIGSVALVYDWCYPLLTTQQRQRWIAYANQAVANVWNPNGATWGGVSYPWSGWSVDNPSNNYYYSFLRATMLLGLASSGENSQAATWITRFRTDKLENQLFPTFNADLTGGGSREGTGYGTAMKNLFQLYDWWERSTGERVATRTPHTLASTAHLVHSIVPTLDRLAPTGDHARDSTAALFDYHREYLLSLISLFPSERSSAAAKALLDASSVPRMQYSFEYFADYLYEPPQLVSGTLSDLSTTYWGSGTGQLMMRSDWSTGATYSNFICGPYTESHAHHDQGSFVIFRGTWLADDANLRSQSGIEQGETLHNLVRVEQGGSVVTQTEGAPRCNLVTLADNALFTYAVADVTPIYAGQTAVTKVEREYLFLRPSTFVVFDRVETAAGARRVFTLNMASAPTISGDRLTFASGSNRLDVHRLAPTGLTTTWTSGRAEVADATGTQTLFLNVMGTNGSVSTATRSDGTGQTGTLVTLADGRRATVRFSNSGRGGTLEILNADGSSAYSASLPTGVTAPSLFRN